MSQQPRTFTLASRASKLAQVQTVHVQKTLQHLYADSALSFETSFMATAGDKNQSQALYLVGGKAFWTKELEVALKEKQVDMLVHCLKDVPTTLPDGCVIGAILEREDPVDSLIVKRGVTWKSLDDLPPGSVVGTSSVRRVAQLKRKYPQLQFQDVRGNLDTRLSKLDAEDGPFAAIILAKAGLVRVQMEDRITADIPPPTLLPAVSQGALAIEIRSDDHEALELCKKLTHRETQWTCLAERACLRVLEGGCSVPVGISSRLDVEGNEEVLTLTGCVTAIDGSEHVEHTISEKVASVQEAEAVGTRLAHILSEKGAKSILETVKLDREQRAAAEAAAESRS